MNDRHHPIDEPVIKRIFAAANRTLKDQRTSAKLRRQIFDMLQTITAACNVVDEQNEHHQTTWFIETTRIAFSIGAICGSPKDTVVFEGGKRGAGGRKSGESRRRKAEPWQAHAAYLMKQIRTQYPQLSNGKVVLGALDAWKLDAVDPVGPRQMQTFLNQLIAEGSMPPKLKRTSSVQK